jgi:hypothetical protein
MRTLLCFLVGSLVAGAVACSSNAPLMTDSKSGTAGKPAGTTGTSGRAGASAAGIAGTSGTAGDSAVGTGGGFDVAGSPGQTSGEAGGFGGDAGFTGAAGSLGDAGVTGAAGAPPITMCSTQATRADGSCVVGAYKRMGVCACQDGTPCICNGSCVDPLTDDDNCGTCGVRCGPTSTCQYGKCGPPVVNFLPAAPGCGGIDLAIQGDTLYWTDAGHLSVNSRPLAGGVPRMIAFPEKSPKMITVAGSTVFWVYADQTIRKWVAGGTPTDVVSVTSPIGGLTVSLDGATVYFSSSTNVYSVPATGGTPTVVTMELHGGIPRALALSGNRLAYPTELNGDVDIATILAGQPSTCGKDDGNGNIINFACNRLARSQGELFEEQIFALPGGRVVWADGANLKAETSPSDANTFIPFDVITSTLNNSISGLAGNGMNLYFGESSPGDGTGGVVYHSTMAPNQTALRIARGQNNPRSLAIGPAKVYWSTSDCTVESQNL